MMLPQENPVSKKLAFHWLVGLVVGMVCFLGPGGRQRVSVLESAIGLAYLNRALDGQVWALQVQDQLALVRSEGWLRRALRHEGRNHLAWRGLGFALAMQGREPEAMEAWGAAGRMAQDFIAVGEAAYKVQRYEEALTWYERAEQLDPTDRQLWLGVGQICQMESGAVDICVRFLAHNGMNWLVDSEFAFGRMAWRFNRRAGATYEISDCPDRLGHLCATVTIGDVVPEYGASWHQCMRIQPDQEYLFSAWVKVDMRQQDGQWRPLYFQGDIDGEPHGYWPGYQAGDMDWTYWEYPFTVPTFDDSWACFHPVRLESSGQVWFYEASLKPLSKLAPGG